MLAPPNGIQIKDKKHCEDQTKSAGGSNEATRPPFCDLWKKKTRGQGQSPEKDPRVRVGQEDQASVFWKLECF